MNRKFVDLSLTLDDVESERLPISIRYTDHRTGALQMEEIFHLPAGDLPGGLGWAGEELSLCSHAGTHMDAPWHYGPRSGGRPARSIDEVPLEWCYGPGVVLDMRHKESGEAITVVDLELALARNQHELSPGEIVLLMTGADTYWGRPDYPEQGTGLNRESVLWLVRRGVRVIGTDGWGLDPPFGVMQREYGRTGSVEVVWSAHFAGREQEYCQLEKLTNLNLLPPVGFTVICFPIKIARGSAGWVRVVAVLEETEC